MQVIETLAEGLKREIKVVIPAKDMEQRMNERLAEAKDKVRINGFRPGKVPVGHLKKMYGKSVMAVSGSICNYYFILHALKRSMAISGRRY